MCDDELGRRREAARMRHFPWDFGVRDHVAEVVVVDLDTLRVMDQSRGIRGAERSLPVPARLRFSPWTLRNLVRPAVGV